VSANYFDALGVRPILGRGFRPEEDTGRNAHPVTVISYRTWKDRYHFDPNIIGRTQYMNGVQHTIIGVAPEKFHGTFVGYSFNFWVPTSMQETFDTTGYKLEDRGARWIEGYAILKRGVSRQQAQAELNSISQRLEKDFPDTNRGNENQLVPLWETPFNGAGDMSSTLAITMAVVFLVLLIACANVSNLLLARSLLRRHEMTMRLALGAGRRRLVRQLVTEGLLLSLIAAVGGVAVAYWCRNALVLAFPPPLPGTVIDYPGQIDWRVLVVSAGICIASTLLFALVPAIRASDVDLSGALKSDGGGVVGGSGRSRLRSALVLVQVSLSFVLLAGTGLLLQSLNKMRNASPGFSTDVVVSVVDLFSAGYKLDRAKIFHTQLLDRVRTLPGVESAALTRVIPFSYNVFSSAPIRRLTNNRQWSISKSRKITSRRLESRSFPVASLCAPTTRTCRRWQLSTKRWLRNIGQERIRSANASRPKAAGYRSSGSPKIRTTTVKLRRPLHSITYRCGRIFVCKTVCSFGRVKLRAR
jgi:predicted permease